jgi:hypothetical protein
MKRLFRVVAIIFAFGALPAFAKAPTINLKCGKQAGKNVESERKYLSKESGGGDIYMVNVSFISKKPDNKKIDKVLRQCLDEAIKLDGST